MKYIVGLDRANLSEEHPAYKIAIANTHGKIVGTCSHASRRLLKDIINHPTLLEPAVWSYSEFNMIMDLTTRKFLILQDIFIENMAISQEKKKVTLKKQWRIESYNAHSFYGNTGFCSAVA